MNYFVTYYYMIIPFVDYMLKNTKVMYSFLALYLLVCFLLFRKLNMLGFFVIAIFIAIKVAVHDYIEKYINNNRKLSNFKDEHIFTVTILLSLIISLPALLISSKIGLSDD